jgi:phage terminase large subunit GpA-like protein
MNPLTTTDFTFLDEAFQKGFTKPDRSTIFDWANKHVELPPSYAIQGRFDVSITKYLVEPFLALADPRIRQVVCMGSVQTGKSLIADILYPYLLVNSPTSILTLMQDDDMAKKYCETRVWPILRLCKPARAMLPLERHDRRKDAIIFPNGLSLIFGGANEGNVQSLSVQTIVGDECWLWRSGILGQFKARTKGFEDTCKRFFISQAGLVEDDFTQEWNSGHQARWGFVCPACKQEQAFCWNEQRDDGTYYGIVFDKKRNDKGDTIIDQTAATARIQCKHCRHDIADTEGNRRALNDNGVYVVQNPNANPVIKSYWWPAWARTNRKLSDLVADYLKAKQDDKKWGYKEPLKTFYQKELAQPWTTGTELPLQQVITSEISDNTEWKEEKYRFLFVDCQEHLKRFCMVARAWAANGESRLLYAGYVDSIELVREKQLELKIKDQHTFVDSGDLATQVYKFCLKYGHIGLKGNKKFWFSWNATKGCDADYFYKTDPKVSKTKTIFHQSWGDPLSDINGQKLQCPLWLFSNSAAKDILDNLRSGKGPAWVLPENLVDDEYQKQMNSEIKEKVFDKKTKREKFRWVKVSQAIANDFWDCEVGQVVIAAIFGLIM